MLSIMVIIIFLFMNNVELEIHQGLELDNRKI